MGKRLTLFTKEDIWVVSELNHWLTCPTSASPSCHFGIGWINKVWCIHRIKYYLTVKRNKLLIHGITSVSFQGGYDEWKKSVKMVTYYMTLFLCHFLKDKTIVMEDKSAIAMGRDGGRSDLKEHREFFFGVLELFWILWW